MALNNPTVIFALWGIFQLASAFVPLDAGPQTSQHPTTANILNVSFHNLSSSYLLRRYADLTLLKISNSTIEKVDKYAFDHLKHLNLLEISNSEITAEIDPDTFSRLPGLEILVLSNVRMRCVNLNLKHVQQLTLSRNEIETLHGDSIIGKALTHLDVSANGLRALEGSFKNLSKLSLIDISKNMITDVGHVFDENFNLLRILASENRIESTKGLTLPWLKNLDLFSNRIAILDSGSFPKMTALEELVLAFNNIKHIDDPFRDLLELKFLNLAWNHIEDLQPHLFRNNLYLTELSLQGNKLKSLNRFQSVHHHLTHLDLSHNQLALTDDDFFASTPALRVLDLSFNRLKTLADAFAPLSRLQVLNLAYNELSMMGHELSGNHELERVNLSSNALQVGVTLFKNNQLLWNLDVSGNSIVDFCDGNVDMKSLAKVNLSGNRIQRLQCLRDWKALCEVDLRRNPVMCGEELDGLIVSLAERGRLPYKLVAELQTDDVDDECDELSLNGRVAMWNSVKRELCPGGRDVEVGTQGSSREDSLQESKGLESLDERPEIKKSTEGSDGANPQRKQFLVVPIGWIGKDEMNKPNPLENPQSERTSWERIEENSELLEDLEEDDSGRRSRFNWYTIALILIGLSLTLTCFNLVVFFYIRMKAWKREDSTSLQKYTFLHNEVYKNTTEPTKVLPSNDGEFILQNHTHNKILSYGKINQFLLSFGLHKKDKDSESAKNILMSPASSNGALNC